MGAQISIRSPKAKQGVNMLKTYQKFQSDRLSMPKKDSQANLKAYEVFNQSTAKLEGVSSGGERFMKKTTQAPNFSMNRSPSFDGIVA